MKIVLKNVRVAFAQGLFTPSAVGDGEPTFGASFLLPKDHPQIKEISDVIQQVAKEKWNEKAGDLLKQLKATDKLCLHDGDTKASYEGFPGNFFVAANNRSRPTVVDRDKTPLTQQDGKPYSGSFVNVSLDVWAQDNKWGKRVNATLLAVQFAKDGESFSGGASFSDDDFEVVDGGDDELFV